MNKAYGILYICILTGIDIFSCDKKPQSTIKTEDQVKINSVIEHINNRTDIDRATKEYYICAVCDLYSLKDRASQLLREKKKQ